MRASEYECGYEIMDLRHYGSNVCNERIKYEGEQS